MPKPRLLPELEILESQIIESMIAGLHNWRADLQYPESHSDMQACVRGLLFMFAVQRSALPIKLFGPCHVCEGLGRLKQTEDISVTCDYCVFGRVEIRP